MWPVSQCCWMSFRVHLASKALSSASNMFLSERTSLCGCLSCVASATMAAKANRQAAPAAIRLTAVDGPPCNGRTEAGQEIVSHSPSAVMRRPRSPQTPALFPSLSASLPPSSDKGRCENLAQPSRTWRSKISHA